MHVGIIFHKIGGWYLWIKSIRMSRRSNKRSRQGSNIMDINTLDLNTVCMDTTRANHIEAIVAHDLISAEKLEIEPFSNA